MIERQLPKIAVLLAAYNGLLYLREQVDSILSQQGVDVKLFISVDVSTDGTDVWANQQANINNKIVVLPHGKQFGGAAANFYRLVKDVDFDEFDFVALADQDDIWLSNKLIRACTVINNDHASAYSSNVIAFWPDGRKALVRKSQPQVKWDFLFEAAGPGCTYVFTQSFANALKARLIDSWADAQKIGLHDWLFYAFARANNYRWIIDDYSGLLYRQHAHNQVGVNAGIRAFMHRATKIIDGWGFFQALKIAKFVGIENKSFVKCWSPLKFHSLIYLAMHAHLCRRRIRDKLLFFLSCLLFSVFGKRKP